MKLISKLLLLELLLVLVAMPIALAEVEKVTKVTRANLITIERPEKDIEYSRLFALFKTESGSCWTGIKVAAPAIPPLSQIILDAEKIGNGWRVTSDTGDTVAETAKLPYSFSKTTAMASAKKGEPKKLWGPNGTPNKITVRVPTKKDPGKIVIDTLYFVSAICEETGERISFVCDDVTDMESAFRTRKDGDEVTATAQVGTPHATQVSSKDPLGNHPEVEALANVAPITARPVAKDKE